MKLGNVIEEIIYETLELCENDVVLTEQLIELVAKATDVTEEFIVTELKKVGSLLTANNAIQGFSRDSGRWLPHRRLTIYSKVTKILKPRLEPFENDERLFMLNLISATTKQDALKIRTA